MTMQEPMQPGQRPAPGSTPSTAGLEVDDSPVTVLQELERERGALFTEKEYREMRDAVLEELARGPKPRRSLLVTFGVIGLLLFILTVIGFYIVARQMVHDFTLAVVGLCALGVWGHLLRGYLKALKLHAQRSVRERLVELEELRAHRLLTQEEVDRIYASIHMGRD
jgi:hypothetical protein